MIFCKYSAAANPQGGFAAHQTGGKKIFIKKHIVSALAFWLVGAGQISAQNNQKSLSECLKTALDNNPAIALSREGVAQKEMRGRSSSTRHLPSRRKTHAL